MFADTRPNLDDARALLARARKHYAEFDALIRPQEGKGIWDWREGRDPQTEEFFYRLHMDRQRLTEAKPIIADSANNIVSALDHVAAALAKANGKARSKSIYFPWGLTNEKFEESLAKVEGTIGAEMAHVLAAARAKYRLEVHHVQAAKQISNSGKHWELMSAAGAVPAVALHVPGSRQRIFEAPGDAFVTGDAFEFHRGAERLPTVPLSIVIGLTIGGLDEGLPNSPDSILECSFRFVEGVIVAVGEATA